MIGGLLEITISFILSNLVGVTLVLAALCSVISLWRRGVAADRVAVADTFLSYILLLVIGVTGLQAFIMHTFFPEFTSAFIGWKPSPFEFEVAVADLSQGVLGVLAFRASRGFRLATVMAVVIMLGGDAIGHVRQILSVHDMAPGNAGLVLYTDFGIPLMLIILSILSRPRRIHL